jgi:cytidylate kinase
MTGHRHERMHDGFMGRVVVITGPPGSGKSTVSEELALLLSPSALVQGDEFFGFLRAGAVDPWLEGAAEQNRAVIEAAAACVGRLARRYEVVYEGVVGPWYLPAFAESAGLTSLHYVLLLPPLAVCLDRVRTRTSHGFKDPAAAEHLWDDFQASLEGLGQHVVDGVAGPTDLASTIADRLDDGSLLYSSRSTNG